MPKKVVLLGDFGVGKTSFGLRLSEDRFEETTIATLGVCHFTCKVEFKGGHRCMGLFVTSILMVAGITTPRL